MHVVVRSSVAFVRLLWCLFFLASVCLCVRESKVHTFLMRSLWMAGKHMEDVLFFFAILDGIMLSVHFKMYLCPWQTSYIS